MARKVVQYREALHSLQTMPSSRRSPASGAALVEEVGRNSARLWRDWVELAPTRLTATQRKEVADYAAALQLMTGPDADRVHSSVRQRARVLQSKVTSLFSCWAVTSLSARGRIPMEPGYFDLVVIDEASQCDIASALPLLPSSSLPASVSDESLLPFLSEFDPPVRAEAASTRWVSIRSPARW
jgi:hypothetical protein